MRVRLGFCLPVLGLLLLACDADDLQPTVTPTSMATTAPAAAPTGTVPPSTLTTHDVYDEVQSSLGQPGMVYQATITRACQLARPGNDHAVGGRGPQRGAAGDRRAARRLGDTVTVVAPWDWPQQTYEGVESLVRALRERPP